MSKEGRTGEELKEASKHLYYELWMFESMETAITDCKPENPAQSYAFLESFLLHARNLMDFYYPRKSSRKDHDDDVIVTHYVDEKDWDVNKEFLSDMRIRINKMLAHLTYHRVKVSPDKKRWPIIEIKQMIESTTKKFIDDVSPDVLDEVWKQKKPFSESIASPEENWMNSTGPAF